MKPFDVKKPSLRVLRYRHHPKYKYVLDLRGFGQGRKFFKTRAEAEAERLRQKTTLERHGQETIGLSPRDFSDFITGNKKLAQYGKTVNDAFAFYLDRLDRVLRCKTTVAGYRRANPPEIFLVDELRALLESAARSGTQAHRCSTQPPVGIRRKAMETESMN